MPELPSSSHLEGQETRESQAKEAERYLRLAEKHPEQLSQELRQNPELSTFLQKILGKEQYENLRQTFPKEENSDIAKLQGEIYSFVGIDPKLEQNPTKQKFLKGLVDSIIVENAELAKAIIESRGVILRDMIAQIFTWEGLKQIAHGLGQSITGLFSGDAYQTGKSAGELGLVTTGAGMAGLTLRRAGKTLMQTGKEAMKTARETLTPEIARIADTTRARVARVVPAPSGDGTNILSRVARQRGSIGDPSGAQPFTKVEGKQTVDEAKAPELKIEKKELGFDVAKNEIYKRHWHLRPHAEFLGELKSGDILGEGVNAIVVRHPTIEGYVVKIPKIGKVDDVTKEAYKHNSAILALEKGVKEKAIPDIIQVPEIQMATESQKGYFIIRRVEGQSIHTKYLRQHPDLQEAFKDIPKEKLDVMTDAQVWRVAMDYGKGSEFWVDKMYGIIDESSTFTRGFLQKNYPEYQKVIEYLEKAGVEHNDLHGGNFMVGNNKQLYLIDFGKQTKP